MSLTLTYFPHGTTTDNEQGISSGWNDAKLSAKGIEQSKELPSRIVAAAADGALAKKFDVIFCSDLTRAVDSAWLAFGGGMAPIIPAARLRECNYGDFNAKPSAIVEPIQEKMIAERFPNGESYDDVKARIADFLAFLRRDYDGTSVAIIAHKGPQFALEVLLHGKTWEQAFAEDWHKAHAWQPGWEYVVL